MWLLSKGIREESLNPVWSRLPPHSKTVIILSRPLLTDQSHMLSIRLKRLEYVWLPRTARKLWRISYLSMTSHSSIRWCYWGHCVHLQVILVGKPSLLSVTIKGIFLSYISDFWLTGNAIRDAYIVQLCARVGHSQQSTTLCQGCTDVVSTHLLLGNIPSYWLYSCRYVQPTVNLACTYSIRILSCVGHFPLSFLHCENVQD